MSLLDRWGRAQWRILRQSLINGYWSVHLYRKGKISNRRVNRLVAEVFIPKPDPSYNVARHLNGDPLLNEYWNLAWGTQKDNCADTIRHGRTSRGERNYKTHLKDDDIVEIRRWDALGIPQKEIATRKSVSIAAVSRIVLGDNWSHLGGVRTSRCKRPTDVEEREIRRLRAKDPKKWTYRALANESGFSYATTWKIVNGKTRKNIT